MWVRVGGFVVWGRGFKVQGGEGAVGAGKGFEMRVVQIAIIIISIIKIANSIIIIIIIII